MAGVVYGIPGGRRRGGGGGDEEAVPERELVEAFGETAQGDLPLRLGKTLQRARRPADGAADAVHGPLVPMRRDHGLRVLDEGGLRGELRVRTERILHGGALEPARGRDVSAGDA